VEEHAMTDDKKQGRVGQKGGPPPPERPFDVGNDQAAGFHRGENFLPRVGQDVRDRAAASASDTGGSTPHTDTDWEARVERGEEFVEEREPSRDVNDDVELERAVRGVEDDDAERVPGR
jgi:hypothetical protein